MQTPCVNICAIDQVTRLCAGCYRSIEEIARWRSYTDAERARIMAELASRKPQDAEGAAIVASRGR